MAKQTIFAVLLFVQNGPESYSVEDCVEGQLLAEYLQQSPTVDKQQLFLWLTKLCMELEKLHTQKGRSCYQWVTPFTIILTEEMEIALLQLNAEQNKEVMKQLQRREIRNHFMIDHILSTYNRELAVDLYGYGKTLQYVFSHCTPQPPLTKTEEWRFRYIISKCLKEEAAHSYSQFKDIQKHFPKSKKMKQPKKDKKKGRKAFVTVLVLFVCALAVYTTEKERETERHLQKQLQMEVKAKEEEVKQEEVKKEEKEEKNREQEIDSYMELGLTYLTVLKDYGRSRGYFAMIAEQDALAALYEELSIYLLGGETKKPILEVLQTAEKEGVEAGDIKHVLALLLGYEKVGEEGDEAYIRLAEFVIASKQWENFKDRKDVEMELLEYLGKVYERCGMVEKAAQLLAEMGKEETEKVGEEEEAVTP